MPPAVFGRYRLREPRRRVGPMVVTRAFDPQTKESVNLALVPPDRNGESYLAWLRAATRTLHQEPHPALAPVRDAGQGRGHVFVATALPRGRPLRRVHPGSLSPRSALAHVARLADALAPLHRRRLGFGGIDEARLWLDEAGAAQLAGFPATPPAASPYRAPEWGEGTPPTPESDLYALGVLLTRLLTGRPSTRPADLARLPPGLQAVVLRATAPDPAERFADLADLVDALRVAVAGSPGVALAVEEAVGPTIPGRNETPGVARRRRTGRRRGVYFLVFLVILALAAAALLGGAWLLRDRPGERSQLWSLFPPRARALVPTLAPTLTPPGHLTVLAPAGDRSVPLGQVVDLLLELNDPLGLKELHLLTDGRTLARFDAGGATRYRLKQPWVPERRGGHWVAVQGSNGAGQPLPPAGFGVWISDPAFQQRHAAGWARVGANVANLRGLDELAPPRVDHLSRPALRERLEADTNLAGLLAVEPDFAAWPALGLVPGPGPDARATPAELRARFLDYSVAQADGFYDPRTGELGVIAGDELLDVVAEWRLAGRYARALLEQHFRVARTAAQAGNGDEALALRALAEGDAALVQSLYLAAGHFSDDQLLALADTATLDLEALMAQTPGGLPPSAVAHYWFPAAAGLVFAQALYGQGGREQLQQAWADPPRSTEQILHPDRYLAGDRPLPVNLPPLDGLLGPEWRPVTGGVLGEFGLRQYLGRQLDPAQVRAAATGWGGDRYAVYRRDPDGATIFLIRVVWDEESDASEFAFAYNGYGILAYGRIGQAQADGAACWTAADTVCIRPAGRETLIVRAPDLAQAGRLLAALASDEGD